MTLKLELLSHLPKNSKKHYPPLLFVHGAFSAAWCWEEYFLPYFAAHDYPAYALSLRGHGHSEGDLWSASLTDYVDDLAQITAQLDEKPILIGHSMGGIVVQKYLEKYSAFAAILMNSVPPTGLWCSLFYMGLRDPLLLQELTLMQWINPTLATPNIMQRALFSNDISAEKLDHYFSYLQGESVRIHFDLMGFDLPMNWPRPQLKMLVLGAENDAFFPPSVMRFIATTYQADCYIFDNMAHAMMLENRWQSVADKMLHWLGKNGLHVV
jgi:pimeloyl-ACP methyl ester carboxylesterase